MGREIGTGGQGLDALRYTQGQGIPLVQPLVDNQRLGSFWVRVGVSIPVAGISIAHNLGRLPSCIITVDNSTGSVIYRTAADKAQAGPNKITLRSSPSATVASLLIG